MQKDIDQYTRKLELEKNINHLLFNQLKENNDIQEKVKQLKKEYENQKKQKPYTQSLKNNRKQSNTIFEQIEKKTKNSLFIQEQIYDLKLKNDKEKTQFQKEFETLQRNKEKVKLIDAYISNMTIIDIAFNQIKEITGTTDIQEIQNTFIKSEEQNFALITYLDALNQQIDLIQDQNNEINKKIQNQEQENVEKQRTLQSTPNSEKNRRKLEGKLKEKQQLIQQFQSILQEIQPYLKQILTRFAQSIFNKLDKNKIFEYQNGLILNEVTLEHYLSDLESFIIELLIKKAIKKNIPSALTSTLLVENIPNKEFKQKIIQSIQYDKYKDKTNQEQELQNFILDKNEFYKIAELMIENKKEIKKDN
ncbi:hypothetical protein IMG5_102240 [Ichthyophthirius multifiliis]|uniref:ODAD1 central coiled coil region domain-containing protein n=1 Tax=Ichthyophthirius multifiliis TaxID=5932 RepID=G0QSM6_ICHMU|nr:hypothetical protein IMG5_102240 [Ichthyophthirius multifiliis]EGR31785.1 hypothetical protein IMG5_102240 [Ichthyophthirius multifiliis]|eukprot:XP_004035271.1 hypothetical protein IMG5_102240 [Ichthyophthirius multifiliis]